MGFPISARLWVSLHLGKPHGKPIAIELLLLKDWEGQVYCKLQDNFSLRRLEERLQFPTQLGQITGTYFCGPGWRSTLILTTIKRVVLLILMRFAFLLNRWKSDRSFFCIQFATIPQGPIFQESSGKNSYL